jgi:hypothetical protein
MDFIYDMLNQWLKILKKIISKNFLHYNRAFGFCHTHTIYIY